MSDSTPLLPQGPPAPERIVGRYVLFGEIAHGGMATVRFGRLLGQAGFSRTVAVKCLHSQYAKDPDFISMFLDEARLAARVRHPNVVPILDVVATDDELFMVLDYVQGETLSRLLRVLRADGTMIPVQVAASIITDALEGLHAAHDAVSEQGEPLGIVHRDVSPQNIMVGVDGVSRVLDFGIAKAAGRAQTTREGHVKGKLPYMAPEQLRRAPTDRRTDVYAAGVVLWEMLTGQRLFDADDEVGIFGKVLEGNVVSPSRLNPDLPAELDAVVLQALEKDPSNRFQTARDMAIEIEKAVSLAASREVGRWVERAAGSALKARADRLAEIESVSSSVSLSGLGGADSVTGMLGVQSSMRGLPVDPAQVAASGLFAAPGLSTENVVALALGERLDPTAVPTQVCSTTNISKVDRAQSNRKTRAVIIFGLCAISIVAGVLFLVPGIFRGPGSPGVDSASALAPKSASPVPAVPSATGLTSARTVTSVEEPSTSASAQQVGGNTRVGGRLVDVGQRAIGPSPTSRPQRDASAANQPIPADCRPPYTIDDKGVRIPKPQCL